MYCHVNISFYDVPLVGSRKLVFGVTPLTPPRPLSSPIPLIHWSRLEGELPVEAKMSMAGAHLHLYNVQYEDEGTYECQAVNSKGKDWHRARISVEGRCTCSRCVKVKLTPQVFKRPSVSENR